MFLELVRDVRSALDHSRILIEQVRDADRKARLQQEWIQAQAPLTQAEEDGHRFVFEEAAEKAAEARRRAEALLDRFSPGGPSVDR